MKIGIIVSSAILYGAFFFSRSLPESAPYENLLATFVYPLIALMGIWLSHVHCWHGKIILEDQLLEQGCPLSVNRQLEISRFFITD